MTVQTLTGKFIHLRAYIYYAFFGSLNLIQQTNLDGGQEPEKRGKKTRVRIYSVDFMECLIIAYAPEYGVWCASVIEW